MGRYVYVHFTHEEAEIKKEYVTYPRLSANAWLSWDLLLFDHLFSYSSLGPYLVPGQGLLNLLQSLWRTGCDNYITTCSSDSWDPLAQDLYQ